VYINTTHAYHGMRGSALPPLRTGTVWRAGGEAEVAMQILFNHGACGGTGGGGGAVGGGMMSVRLVCWIGCGHCGDDCNRSALVAETVSTNEPPLVAGRVPVARRRLQLPALPALVRAHHRVLLPG
jgi:hypothetical protein